MYFKFFEITLHERFVCDVAAGSGKPLEEKTDNGEKEHLVQISQVNTEAIMVKNITWRKLLKLICRQTTVEKIAW